MSGMKMKPTSGGGEAFEVPDAGLHPAVLVAVLDLGHHVKTFSSSEKLTRELLLAWELPGLRMTGMNRNHVLGRTFTFSFHEKSGFRKMVEQWRGQQFKDADADFDPESLLGRPCMLNVVHKTTNAGKTVANIDGVMKLPANTPAPQPTVKPVLYELNKAVPPPADAWLPSVWDGKAAKMVHPADYVKTSHEWLGLSTEKAGAGSGAGAGATAAGNGPAGPTEEELPF